MLLSLGAGSARAVIETRAALAGARPDITVEALLVDVNPRALKYAQELAERFGVEKSFQTVRLKAEEFVERLPETLLAHPPDLVEMVGLLDYFRFDHAVDLVSGIREILKPEGICLLGNAQDNWERPFVMKATRWLPIFYRSPQELGQVVTDAGFASEECGILMEPHQIHMIAVCKKSADG